jgi:phosphatidate cytidylyltransferase
MGSLLIAALVALVWLDETIDRVEVPEVWRWVVGGRQSPPPGVVAFVVLAVLALLAARELARILSDNGIVASKRISSFAALAGLAVSCLVPSAWSSASASAAVASAAVIVLLLALAFYSRRQTFEGIVAAAGGALLAFVYLGLMLGFILAIRREHSAWVVLWVLATTKLSDIGAYFCGRAIGRHKMIRWLSPGKTWEGLAGGIALAASGGAAGVALLVAIPGGLGAGREPPPLWTGALAGAVFALVGQAGDLMASLFKRDAGLKDSSHLVPGFGGVLDVLDSPLLVAPVAFWWLRWAFGWG